VTKKQKKVTPKPALTKRQLSKWQRQVKIRRIVIIAAIVFLAGILIWVGLGYYKNEVEPYHEVVIQVNNISFNMNYYIGTLDAYTISMNTSEVQYMTDFVSNQIVQGELMRQGADRLGIKVTAQEIDDVIKKNKLPNDNVYQDLVKAILLSQKLPTDYFSNNLSAKMEQAHLQVMLIESKEVADEVITKIEASGNFTALVDEFSCNPEIEGDLGWLPKELIPNTLIADAAFNLTPGKISQPIYDKTANKNVGYWLIEVTDKQDAKIKARVILLGSEAEAERVKTELAFGGNFSALAGNYSQHGSKNNGGELGWLKQGDIGSNAFNKIAFNITTNVVSEPVKDTEAKTTGGYWVVQLVDKGEHELSDAVKQKLANNNFSTWLQEQEKNSTIKNYLDAAKKAWAVTEVLRGR
jgi:parvulin-like peptidyl-prolyl isomerase